MADLQRWIARQFGTDGTRLIDDIGFPKQGVHSVGVARQYAGTLGKVASCRVAVAWQFATQAEVVGLEAQLYLPAVWTEDSARMAKAGIPDSIPYRLKWQMALTMLRHAGANGFRGIVLADCRPEKSHSPPARYSPNGQKAKHNPPNISSAIFLRIQA
ncbi:transposase [Telmatocola sphagniphila]|uniref:Transposase n=1 Tax=Telmatocola sphagniphila TaxID=1123043 RepID=A0A8E6BBI4_9BACT|nr:transposase [Telmatocola sphagniphila]